MFESLVGSDSRCLGLTPSPARIEDGGEETDDAKQANGSLDKPNYVGSFLAEFLPIFGLVGVAALIGAAVGYWQTRTRD